MHERLAGELSLPVAVALAAAAHGIALDRALEGYLHAFTANLISAAVRTVPLGQSDGQISLAALELAVRQATEAALAVTSLDEVGTATPCSTGARSATRPSTRGCSAHDRG